jgi:hypothetical protein
MLTARTMSKHVQAESGKARTAILLWLLGIPLPVILLIFLLRGCM